MGFVRGLPMGIKWGFGECRRFGEYKYRAQPIAPTVKSNQHEASGPLRSGGHGRRLAQLRHDVGQRG